METTTLKPQWTVRADGRSLAELVAALEQRPDCRIGPRTQEILRCGRIKTTPPAVHHLAGIKGEELGSAWRRTTENILREARRRSLETPAPDLALRLREAFPQEKLGYPRVIVFHKPLRDPEDHPLLLGLCRERVGGAEKDLLTYWEAYPQTMWRRDDLFVFCRPTESVEFFANPAVFRRRGGLQRPTPANLILG